jgi:ribosomal protein L37AE/L43A
VCDGGAETVQACPECKSAAVRRRNPATPQSAGDYTEPWYCDDCGARFDAPIRRPADGHGEGGRRSSPHVRALLDAGDQDVATDGGVGSFAPVTDGARPAELARELQQKAGVRAAHAVEDCRGPAVEIVLAAHYDALPARLARPIYRRGLAVAETTPIADRTHLQVTVRPGEGSA